MEITLDTKKIAAISIVFVLLIAGMTFLIWPKENVSAYSGPSVDADLDSMTWADILKEAQGQTVCLSFYRSTLNDKFFDETLIPLAATYGVTVTYGDDLGYIGAMNDAKSGGTPKYDMYWMGISGYEAFTSIWWDEDWKSVVPNSIFLSDATDSQVSYAVTGNASGYVGNQIEWSGGQLTLLYNAACESQELAYNAMELSKGTETKTITLMAGTESKTHVWSDIVSGNTYAINDVMALLNSDKSIDVVYGLPNDYAQLYDWAQIYPGQFTYPDVRGGHNSYYVGYSIMYGAGYELAWDASKESWTICTDPGAYYYDEYTDGVDTDDASAVKTAYAAWIDQQTEEIGKNPEGLHDFLGYLYIYLDELDDYVCKVDGKSWYAEYFSEITNKMVGYNSDETRINDKTVMLTYAVTASMVPSSTTLPYEVGMYCMETSVHEQYCWTINSQSKSKAGSMVVANLLNDPYVQAKLYETTGLIPNIDLAKYVEYLGGEDSAYYKAQYERYYSFIEEWASDPKFAQMFISPERLAETKVDANLSKFYIILGELWATELEYQ